MAPVENRRNSQVCPFISALLQYPIYTWIIRTVISYPLYTRPTGITTEPFLLLIVLFKTASSSSSQRLRHDGWPTHCVWQGLLNLFFFYSEACEYRVFELLSSPRDFRDFFKFAVKDGTPESTHLAVWVRNVFFSYLYIYSFDNSDHLDHHLHYNSGVRWRLRLETRLLSFW